MDNISELIDLKAFPIQDREDREDRAYADLVARCQAELKQDGMFNLAGFMHPDAAHHVATELTRKSADQAFTHKRSHNIYFRDKISELPPDHPALKKCETVNHTLCADQISYSPLLRIYRYPPLARFLADTMGLEGLYVMDDPLACANVMTYFEGEALNWHFDRSEFTTTLLLQAPQDGGAFEYRSNLRSDDDPNYDGVAKLLTDEDPAKRVLHVTAGTLNVFRGKNTAHRVTPVRGPSPRMVAVFSYYERPGVRFSADEQIGFYGRTG